MRIISLYIEEFRNLKKFDITFTSKGETADGEETEFKSHAIIGQNGTGKSNLLEAIITIFRDLDLKNKPSFLYKLAYEVRGHTIEVFADSLNDFPAVKIDNEDSSANYLYEHATQYLPSNVFVYYSGKNQRIEDLFKSHQNRFNKLLREDSDDLIRRLFLCRTGHSQLVLLACLLSEDPVFQRILSDLNIESLESALFVLKKPHRLKNLNEKDLTQGDQRFWFARGTVVSEFLDKLWALAIAPIDDSTPKQIDFRGRTEKQDQIYLFLPDKDSLKELGHLVGPPEVFFRYAEGAYIGDLIDEVRITVKQKNSDGTVRFGNLSEGEMQLLTVLGLMRITSQDQCLFLLDEPDTHLNPIWKLRYFDEIEKVLEMEKAGHLHRGESQMLITTHDPIMVGSLRKEQVRILNKDENKSVVTEPDEHPQGMGVSGLLKSDLFGLRSTVDTETLRRLDKRNYLFALGRARTTLQDAELSRLSEELSDLGFASDFKDPYFAQFVQKMALHTKFHKPQLTPEEQAEQDALADEIIDEILKESGQ